MARKKSTVLVRIKYPDHSVYFIFSSKEKRFVPLDEKCLVREIPGYSRLNEHARQKESRMFIQHCETVKKFHLTDFLPNAPTKPLSLHKATAAAKELLSVCTAFEDPYAGYLCLSDILCAMHCQALRQAEPDFRPVISLNSNRPEIMKFFKSLLKASATVQHWGSEHKRMRIHRKAILDFRVPLGSYPRHIQDFSQCKCSVRKYKPLKFPFPYNDTPVLLISADSSQIREAAPYLENAAVILLNSAAGDFAPTKLTTSHTAAYDPAVIVTLKENRCKIAKLLRWWWALDGEDAWAAKIVREARASFGNPGSQYIRVELDPKKLRDAIRYRVLLSFLDELEANHIMTAEELDTYRQGAKDVFDPAPPEPVAMRRAEDPDVFLEVMKELAAKNAEKIIHEDERFVKSGNPFGAWRTINKEQYLVMLEDAWAKSYAKAVRSKKNIDDSFFQAEHWERDLQHILADHGFIKQASSGYRYRYDLMGNGKRDSTYVVAIPAHLLAE